MLDFTQIQKIYNYINKTKNELTEEFKLQFCDEVGNIDVINSNSLYGELLCLGSFLNNKMITFTHFKSKKNLSLCVSPIKYKLKPKIKNLAKLIKIYLKFFSNYSSEFFIYYIYSRAGISNVLNSQDLNEIKNLIAGRKISNNSVNTLLTNNYEINTLYKNSNINIKNLNVNNNGSNNNYNNNINNNLKNIKKGSSNKNSMQTHIKTASNTVTKSNDPILYANAFVFTDSFKNIEVKISPEDSIDNLNNTIINKDKTDTNKMLNKDNNKIKNRINCINTTITSTSLNKRKVTERERVCLTEGDVINNITSKSKKLAKEQNNKYLINTSNNINNLISNKGNVFVVSRGKEIRKAISIDESEEDNNMNLEYQEQDMESIIVSDKTENKSNKNYTTPIKKKAYRYYS